MIIQERFFSQTSSPTATSTWKTFGFDLWLVIFSPQCQKVIWWRLVLIEVNPIIRIGGIHRVVVMCYNPFRKRKSGQETKISSWYHHLLFPTGNCLGCYRWTHSPHGDASRSWREGFGRQIPWWLGPIEMKKLLRNYHVPAMTTILRVLSPWHLIVDGNPKQKIIHYTREETIKAYPGGSSWLQHDISSQK